MYLEKKKKLISQMAVKNWLGKSGKGVYIVERLLLLIWSKKKEQLFFFVLGFLSGRIDLPCIDNKSKNDGEKHANFTIQ
jgi:hypothetical protein